MAGQGSTTPQAELHRLLVEHFSEDELKTLASFELGIDYEDLGGSAKSGKARELILKCQRHQRLPDLVAAIERTRPDISLSPQLRALLPASPPIPVPVQSEAARTPSPAIESLLNPDPQQILPADYDRLRRILRDVPAIFGGDQRDRVAFLQAASLSRDWIANYTWGGPAQTVADQLLQEAFRHGIPLEESRPGYSALGAILNQVLEDRTVGQREARFLAATIVRYRLIDLERAAISDTLRSLLQIVPEPPRTPEAVAAFEAAVRAAHGFLDRYLDAQWLDDGARAAQAVCHVEVRTGASAMAGTGFLLAPSLVLTNYHVVEAAILGEQGRATTRGLQATRRDVTLRFGYRIESGAVAQGQPYRLVDGEEWLLASSPPNALDYAVLQVAGAPGEDQIRAQPRGWLQPPWAEVKTGDPLFIIQHPYFPNEKRSAPLKVVLAANAVTAVGPTRVRYLVNTEPGSSGSPCFDQEWRLAALHHAGPAGANQGIPIAAVVAELAANPRVGPLLQG